jgi:hypothetical protein
MVQIDALGFDAEQRRYCRASQRCDDQAVKQQRVPMVTSRAGTTAVANIQRQASRFGTTNNTYSLWRLALFRFFRPRFPPFSIPHLLGKERHSRFQLRIGR